MLEKFGWSKGKGLGAKEDGHVDHVKVSVKNNNHGLGCTKSYADNWIAHQDDFNALLANLNQSNTQNEAEKVISLENKSKTSRSRVHYQKFTQGKDLSLKTSKDLDCIFGRRNAKQDDTSSSDSADGEEDDSNTGLTTDGGFVTVKSEENIQDYFAKKLASLKHTRSSSQPKLHSILKCQLNENSFDCDVSSNDSFNKTSTKRVSFMVGTEEDSDSQMENGENNESLHSTECKNENDDTGENEIRKKSKKKKSKKRKHSEMENCEDKKFSENCNLESNNLSDDDKLVLKKTKFEETRDESDAEDKTKKEKINMSEIEVERTEKKKKKKKSKEEKIKYLDQVVDNNIETLVSIKMESVEKKDKKKKKKNEVLNETKELVQNSSNNQETVDGGSMNVDNKESNDERKKQKIMDEDVMTKKKQKGEKSNLKDVLKEFKKECIFPDESVPEKKKKKKLEVKSDEQVELSKDETTDNLVKIGEKVTQNNEKKKKKTNKAEILPKVITEINEAFKGANIDTIEGYAIHTGFGTNILDKLKKNRKSLKKKLRKQNAKQQKKEMQKQKLKEKND